MQRKVIVNNIVFILALTIIYGCSTEQQTQEVSQPSTVGPKITDTFITPAEASESLSFNLIFFLNPNGGPCRIQDGILKGMSDEFEGKVSLKYIKTTDPADQKLFYKYGIRALPTLILTDPSGKEIKRMPPGIKKPAEIRAFIESIHSS
jgi:thioredoxin 1